MSDIEPRFLAQAEEYVARHEPDKSAEQIFAEMHLVLEVHAAFNEYLAGRPDLKQNIETMPKKSEQILARRKLFINWYIEKNKGRYVHELVDELTFLTFASETTITNTIYNYR